MAFTVGTWVAPTIRAINTLQIQPVAPGWQFGLVVSNAGADNNLLYSNGHYAAAVPDAELDALDFSFDNDWGGKLVRPSGCTSPEYTGMVVGAYFRTGNGVTGYYLTVALLSGKGYYEILATEAVEVD
jgi:hypothetical protein